MTSPRVCIDENLTVSSGGLLRLAKWSVPRLVADVIANTTGDGPLVATTALPGKLLIEQRLSWVNDAPIDQTMLVRVTRPTRIWITSNPNAIQFRDRWSTAIDHEPEEPVVSGIFNSQVGSAIDVGTNTVAEPNPGKHWMWRGTHLSEEWIPTPIGAGQEFNLWYRCYVWTPPPFSDNANKNNPQHSASAQWTRIQLIVFPQQGELVVG